MKKTVIYNGKCLDYDLQYKNVKNINLRIKPDGSICVSANRWVAAKVIDAFVLSKAEFILKAQEKHKNREKIRYFAENEIRDVIINLCEKAYPYFEKKGVKYPQIKFRKMTSRWGSCNPAKRILTFNINLMYAPPECVRYVVMHEFTHFLQANHSKKFYEELSVVCPDWKICRKKLKEVVIK